MEKSRFLSALKGEEHDAVPVWFMRQAGRSLPEYGAIRQNRSVIELATDPEAAAQLTLLPVERYGVDAAILFSDITLPLVAAGVPIRIAEGVGPVLEAPVTSSSDLKGLKAAEEVLSCVEQACRKVKASSSIPLIGFCGGPFTLACYLVEGRPSKDWARTRAFMAADPAEFSRVMEVLTDLSRQFLEAQIKGGVDAVQIFDSWAGVLSRPTFTSQVAPHLRDLVDAASQKGRSVIYFSLASSHLLGSFSQLGADFLSIDWRMGLKEAAACLTEGMGLQGNLDPALCLLSFEELRPYAEEVLREGTTLKKYVFNLGHGVLPNTSTRTLKDLTDFVHSFPLKRA